MRLRGKFQRRAAIAVLIAFAMIPVLGIVAIVLEGGLIQDQRRQLQASADAAALAASDDLYARYPTGQGLDLTGSARASAISTATANGYAPNGNTTTVTVTIPPQTGLFI